MIRIDGGRVLDGFGRTLILRGVNLGGDSKSPAGPPGWSLRPESLADPETASFVGRPFPVQEADEHFGRLARAGMTFQRLVVTWEAIEHSGPGLYDEDFIDYLGEVLHAAGRNGVSVFVDPHQDVWSRWTGGDGAPAWTLERLGIDLGAIDASGAAITRQRYAEFHGGAPFPRMMWPSNYDRYAAATMFTLFFAGKTYAPDLEIDGANVQEWLQGHYVAAFAHCHRRLKGRAALAGWGVMNEPHPGFIGHGDLSRAENPVMPLGPRPSPWDTILAASGRPVEVPVHRTARRPTRTVLNPAGVRLFREGFECPWKRAGVWTDEGGPPRLLRPDHFARLADRPADFMRDFHRPFMLRFIGEQRKADASAVFFLEGTPPGGRIPAGHPEWDAEAPDIAAAGAAGAGVVNAFHWYDGLALFTKRFSPRFTVDPAKVRPIVGRRNVQRFFNRCLAQGVRWAARRMGGAPSLLGEFGLAFDINGRCAFRDGDYSVHETALSMYYDAVDANLLHSTIWNYSAGNTREHGDGWNDEDLSIFCEGAERAAAGWKRPYPMATAGTPLSIRYRRFSAPRSVLWLESGRRPSLADARGVFRFRFAADAGIAEPTEIHLPAETFGPASRIAASVRGRGGGSLRFEFRAEEQRLLVFNDGSGGEIEVAVAGA